MAEMSPKGITFLDPTSWHGGKDVGFEFVVNRLLLIINTVYVQGDIPAYIRGVRMLVNTSWYLIKSNKEVTNELKVIEEEYAGKLKQAKNAGEKMDIEQNQAEDIHRIMVDLHSVGGEQMIYAA